MEIRKRMQVPPLFMILQRSNASLHQGNSFKWESTIMHFSGSLLERTSKRMLLCLAQFLLHSDPKSSFQYF